MNIVSMTILIPVLIAVVWSYMGIKILKRKETDPGRRLFRYLSSSSIFIATIGLVLFSLSNRSLLNWLPDSFEWPIGKAENILILNDKIYVVPNYDANRIQIYDNDLRFLKGWQIEAFGEGFKLLPTGNNKFKVYIDWTDRIVEFDINGKKLSQENDNSRDYYSIKKSRDSLYIPTNFLLMPFIGFHTVFGFFIFGMISMYILDFSEKQSLTKRLSAGTPKIGATDI